RPVGVLRPRAVRARDAQLFTEIGGGAGWDLVVVFQSQAEGGIDDQIRFHLVEGLRRAVPELADGRALNPGIAVQRRPLETVVSKSRVAENQKRRRAHAPADRELIGSVVADLGIDLLPPVILA